MAQVPPDDVINLLAKHGLPFVVPEKGQHEGVANEVWFAGDVVIRILKDLNYESDVWTETVAVPAAAAQNIRTPKLLVFDSDLDVVPRLVTIYERVPGISLSKVDHLPSPEEFFHDLGRAIREIHERITSVEDPKNFLDPAWHVDKSVLDLEWEYDTTEAPVFCHQDLHPDNIMVYEGKLAAIIDWGDAGWGNRSTDLRFIPARYLASALQGYGPISDVTKRNIMIHQLDQQQYATENNRSYGLFGDSTQEEVARLLLKCQ